MFQRVNNSSVSKKSSQKKHVHSDIQWNKTSTKRQNSELEENYKNTFVVTTLSRFDIQKEHENDV